MGRIVVSLKPPSHFRHKVTSPAMQASLIAQQTKAKPTVSIIILDRLLSRLASKHLGWMHTLSVTEPKGKSPALSSNSGESVTPHGVLRHV